jgi:hypothetical protein
VRQDAQVLVEALRELLEHVGHTRILAVHLLRVRVGEVVVRLAAADVGLLVRLHARAGARGECRIVEDPDRHEQEVGVGLVDLVLELRVGGRAQATEHVAVVLRQELARLLDILGVDERVEQMRQVDVDVLVIAVGVRDQARLHAAIEETVDHEVVRRLQVTTVVIEIDVLTRIHARPRLGRWGEVRHHHDRWPCREARYGQHRTRALGS